MSDEPYSMEDFAAVRTQDWKQRIQADLKGADYDERLVWQSPEGIAVKPFYNREDWTHTPNHLFRPSDDWHSGECFRITDEQPTNQALLDALASGVSALHLSLSEPKDYAQAFAGIYFDCIETHFELGYLEPKEIEKISAQLINRQNQGADFDVFLNLDPIGQLTRTGNWFGDETGDFKALTQLLGDVPTQFHVLGVDATGYQNAGGSITEQLAYALAHAYEYLYRYGDEIRKLHIALATGSNYFFEIAKLRALRLLWRTLKKDLGHPASLHLSARPTLRNKSFLDAYNNALRQTAETLGAVVGGADTVFSMPHDAFFKKPNAASRRMARNAQLLLREEAFVGRGSDPAQGSFYIEALTRQLAEGALEKFKAIARTGGLLENLKEGSIQRACRQRDRAERERFKGEQRNLIGVNRYPNPEEKPEVDVYPFPATPKRPTRIEPLIPSRLAAEIEAEYLKNNPLDS